MCATPFFLACHSDPAASLSRSRSLNTHTCLYTHPSIRNFTLGIFFSLVTSSELHNAASRLCAVFLPCRGVSSSSSLPRPRDLFSHSLLFSALPFVTFCFFEFASDRAFLPPSHVTFPSRKLNSAGVFQRSCRRS